MRASIVWSSAIMLVGATPLPSQTPRFESTVSYGRTGDWRSASKSFGSGDFLAAATAWYRIARTGPLSLGARADATWVWRRMISYEFSSQGALVNNPTMFATLLGPELRLAPWGWLDLRAGAGLGGLWRRDDPVTPGPFFSRALDLGMTLRPNRHGLRLRQLAISAAYRRTWSQESGLTLLGYCVDPCGTTMVPYRRAIRMAEWRAGLSYGFGP